MDFPELPFDSMTEADVREEVIAPLLKFLGYRKGTLNSIERELPLTYEKVQFGGRKTADVTLRGRADYVCEAGGKVRWVIEAKAGSAPLDAESLAQAWSYAHHADVGAVFFALTNGRQFRLHETNHGPKSAPLFDLTYEQLAENLQAIVNTLGPEGLLRRFPDYVIDRGIPLGPGLGSIAQISSGRTKVARMEPNIAPVHELVTTITEGFVMRRPEGGIVAAYKTSVPIESLQIFNERIGLNEIALLSQEDVISTNELKPNRLVAERETLVTRGTPTFDINTWTAGELPFDARLRYAVEATGFLTGRVFRGTFASTMQMTFLIPDQDSQPHIFNGAGTFEIHLV